MVVRPDQYIRSFGTTYMHKQLNAILAEVPGVQSAADLECIHRMRVASRRLRAAQTYFDNSLPRKIRSDWEKQTREMTRLLGQARDLDIQMQTLRRFQILREQQEFMPGIEPLLQQLLTQRHQAQQEVQCATSALEKCKTITRVGSLLSSWVVEKNGFEPSTPMKLLADRAIRARLQRFLSYEPFIHDPERKLELHAMRIAAKRLRYTLEIFSPLDKNGFKSWMRLIKLMQEQLGAIHDCDVWLEFLPQFYINEDTARTGAGTTLFQQNRSNNRLRLYAEFIREWDASREKRIWECLEEHLDKTYPVECTGAIHRTFINAQIEERNEDSDHQ